MNIHICVNHIQLSVTSNNHQLTLSISLVCHCVVVSDVRNVGVRVHRCHVVHAQCIRGWSNKVTRNNAFLLIRLSAVDDLHIVNKNVLHLWICDWVVCLLERTKDKHNHASQLLVNPGNVTLLCKKICHILSNHFNLNFILGDGVYDTTSLKSIRRLKEPTTSRALPNYTQINSE